MTAGKPCFTAPRRDCWPRGCKKGRPVRSAALSSIPARAPVPEEAPTREELDALKAQRDEAESRCTKAGAETEGLRAAAAQLRLEQENRAAALKITGGPEEWTELAHRWEDRAGELAAARRRQEERCTQLREASAAGKSCAPGRNRPGSGPPKHRKSRPPRRRRWKR